MKVKIPFRKDRKTVSVIRMTGAISAGQRGQLNDYTFGPIIDKAFEKGKPAAVALVINSPGGSPVQSSLLGARIRRLSEEKEIPVFAFVEDVAASGGYWIAAAADEIYIDETSIVGSIGVISAGFGAHDFISRYGIERRVYTSGTSKSTLDPFKPEKAEDVERLNALLTQVHTSFITHVKNRRAATLADDERLFSGEFWAGQPAIDLGLADHIGHLEPVMKERFGDNVKFRQYGAKKGWAQRIGGRIFEDAFLALEEKLTYARFGL